MLNLTLVILMFVAIWLIAAVIVHQELKCAELREDLDEEYCRERRFIGDQDEVNITHSEDTDA